MYQVKSPNGNGAVAKETRKVVIRILPPEIDEEDLVSTLPKNVPLRKVENGDGKLVNWIRFFRGKRYTGENKASINARCYISFDTNEVAEKFMQQYHGHQFVDEKGAAFRAVCCFAPYQKIAKHDTKDKFDGTLESDPVYQQWLDKGDEIVHSDKEPEPTPDGDTPLLEHVRSTIQKRRREQRRLEKSWWGESKTVCYRCGTKRRLEVDDSGKAWCRRCWESWKEVDTIEEEEEDDDDDYSRGKDNEDEFDGTEEKKVRKQNCPRRHGLNKFTVDSPDWWCSVCHTEVEEGKKMYGCRACDFDCCAKCYSSGSSTRRERRKRDRREREKKDKKDRRKDRRETGDTTRWEPKKTSSVRIGELNDIDEEEENYSGDWKEDRDKEKERKRIKKRRKEEPVTGSFYPPADKCSTCGTRRRLREAHKGVIYCEKCWSSWGGASWVKK